MEDSGSEQSQSLSRRLNRLSYGSIRGWNLIRLCVYVCIDRASADDTCRPGHAQTIFVSPSAERRRGGRQRANSGKLDGVTGTIVCDLRTPNRLRG